MTNKEAKAILTHNWQYRELIDNSYQYEALDLAIKALEDRPIGEWAVTKSILSDETLVECSLCGDSFLGRDTEDYNYCPICGAKMMKGTEQ